MSSTNSGAHWRTSVRTSIGRPLRLTVMIVAALALLLSFIVPSAVAISPPAPPTVGKVDDSATALKVSWPAVTGAKGYRIQYSTSASFGSPKYFPTSTKSTPLTDTSAVVTGLTTGKLYYFRVAVVDPGSFKVLSETYSKSVSATVSYPFRAPGDAAPSLITKRSMRLSWKAVPNAKEYGVRLATSSNGKARFFRTSNNSIALSGLKASTMYYVKTYVGNASKRISEYSPENQFATSGYSNPAPSGLRVTSQAPWVIKLAWDAPKLAAGQAWMVAVSTEFVYPVPGREPATPVARFKGTKNHGPYKTTNATITGLTSNSTYYAQVYLVDRTKKRVSSNSNFVVAKTVVARGTISGKTSGVTGDDLTASAYLGNELVEQVTVGSDNAYSMAVRAGDYRVMITYTGSGNYASAWARAGKDGGRLPSESSIVRVKRDRTTNAPTVKLHTGAVVSGLVRDRAGRPVRDVDVSALTSMTSAREVEVIGHSAANGKYVIRGLPDGKNWLRYVYSGDGFNNRNIEIIVTKGKITSVRVSPSKKASTTSVKNPFTAVNVRLDNAGFRKRYKASITGNKRVGSTLRAKATPWLAGSYPTTTASMSLQWKRNGKAIKGATRSTYKLKAADRGSRITVTATARRYGYSPASTTSKKTSTIR